MAIVCDGYPEIQVSKENFIDIQLVISGLVDELPEKGFTPTLKGLHYFMPGCGDQGLAG
jgi:hypothetical protein